MSKYLLISVIIFSLILFYPLPTIADITTTTNSTSNTDTRQWTATSTRTQTEPDIPSWNIQSIDDENVLISAGPAVLRGSGWVYLNITSKRYGGMVDLVFGFDSDAVKPKSVYYKNALNRWVLISDLFTKVNFDHLGMDTWYYTAQPVVEDKLYELKYYVSMKFSNEDTGLHKYFVALKPSAETLAQARDNGHLYVLDPWWDNTFTRKAQWDADLSGYSETHTNVTLTLEIPYDADMQVDFDDIRFVDSDDSTQLDAYLVDKTDSTEAWVKVRIPSMTTGSTYTIYMYYGNGGASSDWCSSEDAWDDDYEGIWTFHETSGNVIDLSKNGFDLVPQGSPDQSGTLEPDGSDLGAGTGSGDYYTVGDNAALDPLTSAWIQMWFGTVYDTTVNEGKIMGKFDADSPYPGCDIAAADNTGLIKVYYRDTAGAYTLVTGTTNVFGKTSSIFGVRNVTSDVIAVYVNGTSDQTPGTDNTANIDNTDNQSILARGNGQYPANANVTEARLYRGEMTDERVEIEHKLMFEDLFVLQQEYVFTAVTSCVTNQETVTVTSSDTVSSDVEGTTYVTTTEGITSETSTINSTTTVGTYTISNDIIITVDITVSESVDRTVTHKTLSTTTEETSATSTIQTTVYETSTYTEYQPDNTVTTTTTGTLSAVTTTVYQTTTLGSTQKIVTSMVSVDVYEGLGESILISRGNQDIYSIIAYLIAFGLVVLLIYVYVVERRR